MFGRGICEKYQSRDEKFQKSKWSYMRYAIFILEYFDDPDVFFTI
jgi:hypothetical protein